MTLETAGAISCLKSAVSEGTMPSWEDQRTHVQQLIKEICSSYDPIKDGLVVNAVTGHQEEAAEQIDRIVGLLDAPQFRSSPPFTLQRMAELLTEPFKYYPQNHLAKYLRALERTMLVSSSIDDYGQVSVDIHDVPTVEDGEKIKPDTGIVLTPIPWITDEDVKANDETDEDGVKPVPKEAGGEETKEDKEATEEKKDDSAQVAESVSSAGSAVESSSSTEAVGASDMAESSNISVEMADVSGDSLEHIPEHIPAHDVSVEMTDADLSAEMATHDVPDEVAQEIRQVKNDEVQGDLLAVVSETVTEKHETGEDKVVEEGGKAEKAGSEKAESDTTEKTEMVGSTESEKESSESATTPATTTNGKVETEEDREAKRLKTE